MTIQELEHIEMCAQRGLPVEPKLILMLTAYLRDTLQAKAIAEAIAVEAMRKAGMQSRYYTAQVSR
jgi:hypothetical protein